MKSRSRRFAHEFLPGAIWVITLFLLLDGVSTAWTGAQQLQPARELVQSGQTATAIESLVYIRLDRGLNVSAVRVLLEGRTQMIRLTDTDSPESLDALDNPPQKGWQPATATTGYEAPFEVRYTQAPDGSILAMATADIGGKGSYRPLVEGLIAIGVGLVAAAGQVVLHARRRRRATLTRLDRPSPV